jgi:hypothetical protein
MPAPHIGWLLRLTWLCLSLVSASPAFGQQGDERLLSDAEIAGLERENAMWRLVKPGEGMQANVTRLRQAGYSPEDIAALQPQLAAVFTVPFERNFGWLRPETVEEVREIDRQFIGRMRAVQLYRRSGVQVGDSARESMGSINRQWRDAILEVLDHRESAEFRLMNSGSARDETRLTKGLTLTADEQRTLFGWRQDYDGRHGVPLGTTSGLSAWQREAQLDQCGRIRYLLGDERFAIYLSRVNPGFEQMRAALSRLGETNSAAMLDLWWLRQREAVAIDRRIGLKVQERNELVARLRGRAAGLLGEVRLAAYLEDEDGRWLTTTVRQRKMTSALPAKRGAESGSPVEKQDATP